MLLRQGDAKNVSAGGTCFVVVVVVVVVVFFFFLEKPKKMVGWVGGRDFF